MTTQTETQLPSSAPSDPPVAAACHSPETMRLLAQRRSTPAKALGEPGPSDDQIRQVLTIAARAPDHGKLTPWRFIVFSGQARAAAGDVLAKAWPARAARTADDDGPERIELERGRFLRAPAVIAVVSCVREDHKIPVWEQQLSAGAVCQNLLVAAHAMGFAGQWLTEWYAYDADVRAAFGLKPGERIAGYVYLGTARVNAAERTRPDVPALTTWWDRTDAVGAHTNGG